MTSWIVVIATSALTLGIEGEQCAKQGPKHRGGPSISRYIERVTETVDADEEQVAQFEAIAAEHDAAMASVKEAREALTDEQEAELKDLHKQVREARRDGNDEEVETLRAQIHEIMGADPRTLMKTTQEKIAAVLTPEQLPEFEALQAEHKSFNGRERGKGFRGDRGHGNRNRGNRERGERRGRSGRGGGDGRWMEHFVEQVIDEVDVTEEQQAQIAAIVEEHTEAMKAAREERRAAHESNREQMKELFESLQAARAEGDSAAAKAIGEELKALRGASGNKAAAEATLDKIAAVMTEDQLPAYEALVEETKAKLADRRGSFKGRRGRGGFRGERGPRFDRTE